MEKCSGTYPILRGVAVVAILEIVLVDNYGSVSKVLMQLYGALLWV